jgi:hypothetical protein
METACQWLSIRLLLLLLLFCCCRRRRETADREGRKARDEPVVLFRKLFETPGENNEKIPDRF